jgi:hypothetical protein
MCLGMLTLGKRALMRQAIATNCEFGGVDSEFAGLERVHKRKIAKRK